MYVRRSTLRKLLLKAGLETTKVNGTFEVTQPLTSFFLPLVLLLGECEHISSIMESSHQDKYWAEHLEEVVTLVTIRFGKDQVGSFSFLNVCWDSMFRWNLLSSSWTVLKQQNKARISQAATLRYALWQRPLEPLMITSQFNGWMKPHQQARNAASVRSLL